MSSVAIAAQTLKCKLQILNLYLAIEAIGDFKLSRDPWQKYTLEDYDSPELFCHSCLVDLNDRHHYQRDAKLCWLPIKAPRQSKTVYLEALRLAEEFLINPKNEHVFGDRKVRIQAAQTLVSVFQIYGQSAGPELVELSESE